MDAADARGAVICSERQYRR